MKLADIVIITDKESNAQVVKEVERILQKFKVNYVKTILQAEKQAPAYLEGIVEEWEKKGTKIFIVAVKYAIDMAKVIASYATESYSVALTIDTKTQIVGSTYRLPFSCVRTPNGNLVAEMQVNNATQAACFAIEILALANIVSKIILNNCRYEQMNELL